MSAKQVSAVIICRNEEAHIERSLASLSWADEILVVDALSEDRTLDLCQADNKPWSKKIRVIQREWRGFGEQRNFALSEAQFDWVFMLDADEECSSELAQKIRNLLESSETLPTRYFKVRRVEYFLKKPILYGIWNPSYQDRFFHREGVKYVNNIHEYPVYPKLPESIHEPIHHYPNFAPEKFLEKMNKYTTIEARDRVARGQTTNWFRLLFAFPAMFYKNYIYYGAYRDGMHGFVISLLEGVSRVVRHIKIWQFSRENQVQAQTYGGSSP